MTGDVIFPGFPVSRSDVQVPPHVADGVGARVGRRVFRFSVRRLKPPSTLSRQRAGGDNNKGNGLGVLVPAGPLARPAFNHSPLITITWWCSLVGKSRSCWGPIPLGRTNVTTFRYAPPHFRSNGRDRCYCHPWADSTGSVFAAAIHAFTAAAGDCGTVSPQHP